jgi:hypothetical protein
VGNDRIPRCERLGPARCLTSSQSSHIDHRVRQRSRGVESLRRSLARPASHIRGFVSRRKKVRLTWHLRIAPTAMASPTPGRPSIRSDAYSRPEAASTPSRREGARRAAPRHADPAVVGDPRRPRPRHRRPDRHSVGARSRRRHPRSVGSSPEPSARRWRPRQTGASNSVTIGDYRHVSVA